MLKRHSATVLLAVLGVSAPAMAQFDPLPNSAGVDYLRGIFGGLVDYSLYHQDWSEPGLIGSYMIVFGTGAYFLGMLYFLYNTLKEMLDSAETGKFLGRRQSKIKLPVRVISGAFFLLPAKNGFSLIQILVMWIALQGVGLGDKSMAVIMEYFKTNQYVLTPVLPDSRPLAASVFKSQVCTAALNKGFEAQGLPERVTLQTKNTDYSVGWFDQNVPVSGVVSENGK